MKNIFFCSLLVILGFFNFVTAQQSILPSLNSYQPPVFSPDERIQRIQTLEYDIHKMMEAHGKKHKIPGIAYGIVLDDSLVIKGGTGTIHLEKGLNATSNSIFRIASMTKSFTSMAILKLRDEGNLSLDDHVSKFIPEMADLVYLTSDAPAITIRNLLNMTAGFPEDNPWGDRQLNEPDQMLLELIQNGISFSNVPSYQYEYSNTGYAILGLVITRITGMPYQKFIQSTILQPLGMDNTYWEYSKVPPEQLAIGYRWEDQQWKLEPMLHDGSFGAMGGLMTSIEDFSKYVKFHLSAWPPRSGEENGPLKRSTIREMHVPTFVRMQANNTDIHGNACPNLSGYGFGLGITQDCKGIISVSHGGALPGFGSNYVFFPEYGIGLMAFGNLTYTSPWPLEEIKMLLFENLDLKPRELPIPEILEKRKGQIIQLIQKWDPKLENEILAENFYMDKSREHRIASAQKLWEKAGTIKSAEPVEPQNQLRGNFILNTGKGKVRVFFTLTPEKDPKIQQLDMEYLPDENFE